jgi:hypothetical protein
MPEKDMNIEPPSIPTGGLNIIVYQPPAKRGRKIRNL